jgi:hypothetical protein
MIYYNTLNSSMKNLKIINLQNPYLCDTLVPLYDPLYRPAQLRGDRVLQNSQIPPSRTQPETRGDCSVPQHEEYSARLPLHQLIQSTKKIEWWLAER